jgi:hypothetical protein
MGENQPPRAPKGRNKFIVRLQRPRQDRALEILALKRLQISFIQSESSYKKAGLYIPKSLLLSLLRAYKVYLTNRPSQTILT